MPDRPPDETVAKHLRKVGLLTEAQIQDALREQTQLAGKGETVALGDIFVRQGRLTAEQRENIERKLEVQQEESKRLGPYRVLKKLGEGGMGAVYLAENADTGERIAIKVLPRVAARNQDMVRRFLREVESARRLEHPNIVRAGAAGEDKGFHYYAMEYVEGETLGAQIKRKGSLSTGEATRVMLHVAAGLQYAHTLGFIHRDIKPDNVIVTREGVAKILDMGLSKNIDESQTFRTVTGVSLGTPHYIAPEQARGDKGIDGRADIYSLGATYYHAVTGETPFQGSSAIEIISQHLHKQIPDPRDVRDGIPDGVVHVIRRMMAKKPQDRYRDCGELIADFDLVLSDRHPSSQAMDAARSVMAPPMTEEERERFQAQIQRRSPDGRRGPASPRERRARAPRWVWRAGAAAAWVLILALVLVLVGRSHEGRGGARARTVREATERDPSGAEAHREQAAALGREKPISPISGATQPPKSPAERRAEEAQTKLDQLAGLEREGRLNPDEIRRRYAAFAGDYADTPAGASVAGRLATHRPNPPSVPDGAAARVAHWTLNDNAASPVVADSAGRFPAAWTRNTNLDSVEGRIKKALRCNAANYADAGNVLLTPNALLDADGCATKPFSIAAWVYRTAPGDDDHIVAKQDGNPPYRGMILRCDRSNTLRFDLVHAWSGSAVEVRTVAPIALRSWTHCLVTYDGSTRASGVKLYVNGVAQPLHCAKDTLMKKSIYVPSKNLQIGSRDGVHTFHGTLDDVRVYASVLTQRHVDALYNQGAGTEEEQP